MKITLIILLGITILIIAAFFYMGVQSKSGNTPGLVGGQLSQCSNKPNCVCSEYSDDKDHAVDPIALKPGTDKSSALNRLKSVITRQGGELVSEQDNYLAATFTSSVFGFVDDVEARIDTTANVIHLRSASRVGYSDWSVNSKRVEALRMAFSDEAAN